MTHVQVCDNELQCMPIVVAIGFRMWKVEIPFSFQPKQTLYMNNGISPEKGPWPQYHNAEGLVLVLRNRN